MKNSYAPPVPEIKKWIKALRSGEFSQTEGCLQDGQGFCCLGVACQIFAPTLQKENGSKYMRGGSPSDQRYAPTWLKRVDKIFMKKNRTTPVNEWSGDTWDRNFSLIDLNDEQDFSFDEIADMLQLVFVEKALG